jgi:hypothetical protein
MAHLVVLPSVVVSSWLRRNCDDSFRCMGANGVLLVGIPSLDVDVSLNPLLVVLGTHWNIPLDWFTSRI